MAMAWGLIKNNLKLMLRSKWILVFMIVAPVVIISLLANVFEAMMAIDYSIKPFVTGYRMTENSKYEDTVGLLSDIAKENNITLSEYPEGDIESLIIGGNVTVFVDISDDKLIIYRHDEAEAESAIVEAMFSAVSYKINEAETILTWQAEQGLTTNGSAAAQGLADADAEMLRTVNIETDPVPSAKDYYGIIEIVYFMWCGCISLAAVIPSERKNKIGVRLRLTSASSLQLYLGKFIPCWLATIMEMAVALMISIFFLDVHWGNWPGSILILFLLSLAATAFGMILFTVFSHVAISMAAAWVILFAMGFVGGSYMTYMYSVLPDAYIRLSPQYYVNRTLVEFSTQGRSDTMIPCIIILLTIFLVCTVIGFPIASRKEVSQT